MAVTHQTFDTYLFADCVAWNESILACGTYQLHEESKTRKGGVLIYELNEDKRSIQPCVLTENSDNQQSVGVVKGGDSASFGVLDMKWINSEPHPQLITACANGCVKLMNIVKSGDLLYSYTNTSLPVPKYGDDDDQSIKLATPICLSVDHAHNNILATDSNGCITLGKIENNIMGVANYWKGHAHEAWTAIFGCDTNTVLSGGDDCRLCIWDMRCEPVTNVASKRHDMGVVSIATHPGQPMQFASGSYDEILSLWDQRNIKRPLQELPVGGGVWRIKWNNPRPSLVALACMHGGFKIVDISKNEIISTYDGHESLAYGIDWYQNQGTGIEHSSELLASCSFYDHSLQIWTFQ